MAQHFRVLVIPYRRIYAVSKRNIDEFDRGDSTDTNQKVGQELEVGLGARYTPSSTKEVLETFSKQIVDSLKSRQKKGILNWHGKRGTPNVSSIRNPSSTKEKPVTNK
ncbi:uncharacterized protein LOC111800880 [Cucurbita pepo subsp. pepo]|uniref:uncharacterized protein LOC111800880 n=1 Tax=Cucurbita pepo subsp. pepo TaxID=3664 RepID=UPI000C9D7BB0|nr:uncharacterized protein LOC111800880 [Cucurbita pepo subsp. pepo]XP_023540554.1 uncharacterized protein LOC111800880 [Cucurbita pepo subsp. pepo]